MESTIRCAEALDKQRLLSFLTEARLETSGVEEFIDYFLLLENEDGSIRATLGIEPLGEIGLLRSLVMTSRTSEKDILLMFEQMLVLARDKQLQTLYLATNKEASLPFFMALGFVKTEKEDLPEGISLSTHGNHLLTVDNSVFLMLNL